MWGRSEHASFGLAPGMVERAQGCLLSQLAGDALGGLVEFRSPRDIQKDYPNGVRLLQDGGTWGTIAGQPTDDSELALALARLLAAQRRYDLALARAAYQEWLASNPFDCGHTIRRGLRGQPDPDSQANGALMRISLLGIFGARYPPAQVAEWARQDAALTHPHPICQQANALFAMAIAQAVRTGCGHQELYQQILSWAEEMQVDPRLLAASRRAQEAPPPDYRRHQGWVLIAWQNALWQLLHAPNLEEGVVHTVMQGGDTDTNAAICGALLGAAYGRKDIPLQWQEALRQCRPLAGDPHVRHPRPPCYWPVDALKLAAQLLAPTGGEDYSD